MPLSLLFLFMALAVIPVPSFAQNVIPHACATTTVVTGGTAVVALTGAANGFYIVNPTTAADQGITTAESLFVDPVNTATVIGNSTNSNIAAGNSYSGIPSSSATVSVNAVTAGHKFTCVRW
jgi:hypothetical protein